MRVWSLSFLGYVIAFGRAQLDDWDLLDNWMFGTPVKTSTTKRVLNDFRPGMLTADVVFLVDVTASMATYIEAVKTAIFEIVQRANRKSVSLRTAFIGYRDPFGSGQKRPSPTSEATEFEILAFTRNIPSFQNFVKNVKAKGGGDFSEDVFGGLQRAGRLDWDAGASRRVLFHIADSPPHGSQFGGSGRHSVAGDPLRRDLSKLLGDIRNADIRYGFGQVDAHTEQMMLEFSDVWGAPIKPFKIKPVRGPVQDAEAVASGRRGKPGDDTTIHEVAERIVAAVDSLLDI